MEKQTLIFTALPHGRADDGALRVSVFVSPRLWSDDPAVTRLDLAKFGDFLDWPARVRAATWRVEFDGGPSLPATVESAAPRDDLWRALFRADTDVLPYRFDDFRGSDIETFPSARIHDFLKGLYARAASDPGYGAGRDLPTVKLLADDPQLREIARDSTPEEPFVPPRTPEPVDLGGTLPPPEPEPEPETPGGCARGCTRGCGCGCLALPFRILLRLLGLGGSAMPPATPAPATPTAPFPASPPPAPAPPEPAPVTPPAPPPPSTPNRAAFDELGRFVEPWTEVAEAMPTAADIQDDYDFHRMISALGDYPLLLRLFGVVVDLRVEVDGGEPPASGTVRVEPGMVLDPGGTVVTPSTHYLLDDASFNASPRRVNPEIHAGLLRLDDTDRFSVVQLDVVGGGTKVRNTATGLKAYRAKELRAPNMPDDAGLPTLRTGGVSVVRHDLTADLLDRWDRSYALQLRVFALDGAPQAPEPAGAGTAPAPTNELFAEDLVRGYRIDVFDSRSSAWHSLCQRVGHYHFLEAPDAPTGAVSLTLEDEGFVQFSATEPLKPGTKRRVRATDSLFVWDGWSLCAPRPGLSIMPAEEGDLPEKVRLDTPENAAVTAFKLETSFEAKPGTLPRLRFHHRYRVRARVCDLAGNSVFSPGDPAFAADVAERTPEFPCARFEPVAPPPLMLREPPVEGESLERLVVRTPAVGGETQATERHVIPPKVSQLMAEQHGRFDGTPEMDGSAAGYALAAREAGSIEDGAVQTGVIWTQPAAQFTVTHLPDPAARGALLLGLPGLPPGEIVEPGPAGVVNKIPFSGAWPDLQPFRIRLEAIPAAAAPAQPKWRDNGAERLLVIQLPEAEQRTVRLSSYLAPEDLDALGVWQWVRETAPADAPQVEKDTVAGRSWPHLPWREITLVHAVQKPLQPPVAHVDSPAGRSGGQTFATISGRVTTHPASTGKVDLTAEWEDPVDDVTLPTPTSLRQQAHLCEVRIEDGVVDTPIRDSAKNQEPIQNFGDTRHRQVRYRPVASTRFREYFPDSITGDLANISLAGPPSGPVTIRSSARPDAPKVLYVVPTYAWEEIAGPGTVERRRKGGGLRVYLDRPWYSSGAGELLGVVFADGMRFSDIPPEAKGLVTQWGADPIWLSEPTPDAAQTTSFLGAVEKGGLALAEGPLPVSVAGYPVSFDPERKLWFADVELDIGTSYAPFVRLALARYQPESVSGVELSPVARAEFAQLAADRTASVAVNPTAAGATIDVRLRGATYFASGATLAADRSSRSFDGRSGHAEVEALLQRRDPGRGSDPHLGWTTLSTTLLQLAPGSPAEWTGSVSLAAPLMPDTFRILLREYEWHRADFQGDEARMGIEGVRRMVYADAIPIG